MTREPTPEPTLSSPAPEAIRQLVIRALGDASNLVPRLGDPSDEEAVHDFRVAVRRLRTFLRAFAGIVPFDDALQQELRDLTGLTNDTRDVEAHGEWLRARLEEPELAPEERRAAAVMLARLDPAGAREAGFESESRRVLERAGNALTSEAARSSGAQTEAQAAALADVAFGEAVASVLGKEARQLRKRLGRIETRHDVRPIHRARLSEKRLRYVLELVAEQVENTGAPLESLKSLQDTLGELHDLASLDARIGAEDPVLTNLIRRRRDRLFGELRSEWLESASYGFFENFGRLTKILRAAGLD